MKKFTYIAVLLGAILFSCTLRAQKKDDKNSPQKEIKVNKEYDQQGNLIRYDSTYVYSWSSDSCFTPMMDSLRLHMQGLDEMHKQIRELMKSTFHQDSTINEIWKHPFFDNNFMDMDLFDQDSTGAVFPNKEIFQNIEKMMNERMLFHRSHFDNFEKMRQHMDSIRREFYEQFHDTHPHSTPPKAKPQKQNYKTIKL